MKPHIPKYVTDCEWDSTQKKQSRIITIIELYKHIFNRKSIPEDKQYWSMCGAHFNESGPIQGELGHLSGEGLISPNQFNGVDRELSIIETNRKLHPTVKWFHGDFLEVMDSQYLKGDFNPEIINYDGVMQPRRGTIYLKDIMKFIDHNVKDRILLIANFILVNPYTSSKKYKFTIEDVLKKLSKIYWIPSHWSVFPQAYTYPGSSPNNATEMGMVMFSKQEHDINKIHY